MKTLLDADPGPFRVFRVMDFEGVRRFVDLGVGPGDVVEKLASEEDNAPPLRIRTRERSGVIGAGMGLEIWVEYRGGVVTLASLPRGASGVVTALYGGEGLRETAQILGIRQGEEIRVEHGIPPMDYVVGISGRRVRLGEGEAAKVWGRRRLGDGTVQDEDLVQLTSLGAGQILAVERIAAGHRAMGRLEGLGLRPGVDVEVFGVEPRQGIRLGRAKVVRIRNRFGMELWLGERSAAHILGEGVRNERI